MLWDVFSKPASIRGRFPEILHRPNRERETADKLSVCSPGCIMSLLLLTHYPPCKSPTAGVRPLCVQMLHCSKCCLETEQSGQSWHWKSLIIHGVLDCLVFLAATSFTRRLSLIRVVSMQQQQHPIYVNSIKDSFIYLCFKLLTFHQGLLLLFWRALVFNVLKVLF